MTDLISRKAALTACLQGKRCSTDIMDAIHALPSYQLDDRTVYLRGWNDAIASIPKRVIDDPGMFANGPMPKQTPDPVVNDPAAIREAALREAEKALRDWQDALNANRFPETAITVGVAADAILALIDKGAG